MMFVASQLRKSELENANGHTSYQIKKPGRSRLARENPNMGAAAAFFVLYMILGGPF